MQVEASIFALFIEGGAQFLPVDRTDTEDESTASFNAIMKLIQKLNLNEEGMDEDLGGNTGMETLLTLMGQQGAYGKLKAEEVTYKTGKATKMLKGLFDDTSAAEQGGESIKNVPLPKINNEPAHKEATLPSIRQTVEFSERLPSTPEQTEQNRGAEELQQEVPVEDRGVDNDTTYRELLTGRETTQPSRPTDENRPSVHPTRHIAERLSRQETTGVAENRIESNDMGQQKGSVEPINAERKTAYDTTKDGTDGEPPRHQSTTTVTLRGEQGGTIDFSLNEAGLDDVAPLPREHIRAEVLDKLSGYITRLNVTGGRAEAKLVLNPPELGRLQIEVEVKNSKVQTKILVEHQVVKDVLHAEVARLKELFLQQGLTLERYTVETTTGWTAHREPDRNNNWSNRRVRPSFTDAIEEAGTHTNSLQKANTHRVDGEGKISVFA